MQTIWNHLNQPSAGIFNEYRAALIAAHDGLGDLAGWSPAQERVSSSQFVLLHTWRYLHFTSNGKISNLDGSQEQDINEDDSGQGVIDLDTLDWLVYRQLYQVTGVSVCLEDWSP
jgi:hypothetical protein